MSRSAIAAYFDSYVDLWANDEALGFEGIFFSEHHFGPGFAPSPNLLVAAVAQRTRKLRLGVMGVVTPYYPPWRLVEEIGMLDHLSHGRLEIGTAIGIPQELARVNISMEEARERNEEALEILDAALSNNVVSYKGKYTQIDNLRLVPPPLQQPAPPKWTTILGVESARNAARRGSKICTGFNSTAQIEKIFDAYRDEAARLGFPADSDHLAIRRRVAIAENEAEAHASAEAMLQRVKALVADDPRAVLSPVPDAPPPTRGFVLSEDEFIAGMPEQVAERIIGQCTAVGAGHFLAVLHWGAPFAEVERAHQLFGRRVIPRLRRTELTTESSELS